MTATSAIFVSLMGPPAIRIDGERQQLAIHGQTRALFYMLSAHANRGIRRARLAEALWPDTTEKKANSALNTAVWRINKVLMHFEGASVTTHDGIIKLNLLSPAVVDVVALEAAVEMAEKGDGTTTAALENHLAQIVGTCRGPFMDGLTCDWALPLREKYHEVWVQALHYLMAFATARSEFGKALTWGRAIIAADPFRETIQREVMHLYALNGQRAKAIQHYLALKKLLKDELDIAPLPETAALAEKLAGPTPCDPRSFRIQTAPIGSTLHAAV
ncbi:MAG: AfsR/SARP family transcriptional regulator [Shimia sp.]|uniref:AfsR/SARP family transcriptional regulator n=1 Tax=Shimia sp. TaxID=1954381 RepID=UPI004057D440